MQDREPTYPGRVTLTPVYGLANTYDMERADRPLQEGTPINKASLLKDATAALFGKTNAAVPDDILSLLSKSTLAQVTGKYTKTTIGALAVGKTITLNVSGSPKEFIVVNQGKPSSLYDDSCNGTWLLMKDIYEQRQWHSPDVNKLESSTIHSYLNSTFLNRFDSNIKNAIKQVKIPYRKNGGKGGTDQSGANGLSAKIFLLSGYEVGWTTSGNLYFPQDGAKMSYFESGTGTSANNKRIAKLNGSAADWWLRSPDTHNTNDVWYVVSNGSYSSSVVSATRGIRPALILPSTFVVYIDSSGNAYTEQKYETKITDVLGNLISIPADQIKDGVKIATGSYTGTGTYGAGHPNSLTFEFEPKMVFIGAKSQPSANCAFVFNGQITFSRTNSGGGGDSAVCSFSGNTFTWYSTSSSWGVNAQMNSANVAYLYFAIG